MKAIMSLPSKKPKFDPTNLSFEQLKAYAPVPIEKPELCELQFEEETLSQPSTSSASASNINNVDIEPDADAPNNNESNDLSNSPSSPPESDNDNQNHSTVPPHRSPTFVEHVLNAIGHPTVLKQVALQFLNNVKQHNSNSASSD